MEIPPKMETSLKELQKDEAFLPPLVLRLENDSLFQLSVKTRASDVQIHFWPLLKTEKCYNLLFRGIVENTSHCYTLFLPNPLSLEILIKFITCSIKSNLFSITTSSIFS